MIRLHPYQVVRFASGDPACIINLCLYLEKCGMLEGKYAAKKKFAKVLEVDPARECSPLYAAFAIQLCCHRQRGPEFFGAYRLPPDRLRHITHRPCSLGWIDPLYCCYSPSDISKSPP